MHIGLTETEEIDDKRQIWYTGGIGEARGIPVANKTTDTYIVIHCKEVTNTRHDQKLKKNWSIPVLFRAPVGDAAMRIRRYSFTHK